jgi:rSAM/selenodomain-associated transferase 2
MISIIIPTYNEADHIERTLQDLLTLKEQPVEILVADGGSTDETVALAAKHARVIYSGKGKGLQLNTAAKEAAGEILFFVHADMHVPPGALSAIEEHIYAKGYDCGGFLNVFSEYNEKIKRLGRIINFRIKKGEQPEQCIFYGDNGIFVRKNVFERLHGFKEIPIMEDYELSIRMRSKYKVGVIKEPKLILSPRRQLKDGFIRTHLKWFFIKKLYLLGISPIKLADWYKDIR